MSAERTHFPLLGEPLALDLTNTIVRHAGQEVDLLSDERQLQDWLEQQGTRLPPVDASPHVLEALRALRTPLKRCLTAVRDGMPPPSNAVAELNRAAAAAPASAAIEPGPGGVLERVSRRSGAPGDQAAAAVAESAIELLTERDLGRLRECASQDCVLLFYAAHPARRWCTADGCGNRERVRRHYRRQRP